MGHLTRHLVLVDPNDGRHVLRIEPARQIGGPDKIAKHHRERPTLGIGRRNRAVLRGVTRDGRSRPGRCFRALRQRLDRRLQPPPGPERKPQHRQILVAQMRQVAETDRVVDERLRVLAEAEVCKPAVKVIRHAMPLPVLRDAGRMERSRQS
jgi:hypothetical protein